MSYRRKERRVVINALWMGKRRKKDILAKVCFSYYEKLSDAYQMNGMNDFTNRVE